MALISHSARWRGQPPNSAPVRAFGIPQPHLILRPNGLVFEATGAKVSSQVQVNPTRANTRGMRGIEYPGAAGDGSTVFMADLFDRNSYAVAVTFRVDSIASEGTVVAINQQIQLRVNTSGQLDLLQEAVSLLGTSTAAIYTPGSVHTVVVVIRSGGPSLVYSGGSERIRSTTGVDGTNVYAELGLGRRLRGTSQALDGAIYEAALWAGSIPDPAQAAAISADYYGAMFAARRTYIPSLAAGGGTPTLSAATFASLTSNSVRPRVTLTF